MKKMMIALLSLTLALSLAACGGGGPEAGPESGKAAPETEANAPDAEPNASEAEANAPDTEANASDAEANAPDEEATLSGAEENASDAEANASETEANTQIANPFTDYASLAEAEAAAGYGFAVPDSVDGYPETSYSVMNGDGGKLLQIIYSAGDDEITVRKAPGADAGDISGDYNQYEEETIVDKTDVAFTVKSNGGKAFVALWTDDENDYAYSLTDRNGMDMDAFTTLVMTIQDMESGYEIVEAEAE